MSNYLDKLAHVQVVINCRYSVAQMYTSEDMLAYYLDKLAHVQVAINCRYSIAQMCTREDMLAQYFGAPLIDDVMRYNTLITLLRAGSE